MSRAQRGWILAIVHALLALSVAGKFLYDRETLPRTWARVVPYDPVLPFRGRYIRLWIEVDYAEDEPRGGLSLRLVNGRLTASENPAGDFYVIRSSDTWIVNQPLAFFIPDDIPDPSRRPPNEELWVEVSVPEHGLPRPIRLGVRTNGGEIVPLDLR